MSDLKGKTVLVTGAGGFIPSHLVELLLKNGANVRAFARYNSRNHIGCLEDVKQSLEAEFGDEAEEILSRLEVRLGDVTDPFSTSAAVEGCSIVFHLAALIGIPYSYAAPASYVSVNVNGTLNVLEACRRFEVERLVATSTSETYGTAQYEPIDEKHPSVGQSPYAASKAAADQLAISYHRSFDTPVVIVRPFNTYGPRQSMRAVLPTILAQALKADRDAPPGEPIEIKLGSLDPVRDLTYVTDTARGFLAAALAPASVCGQAFNLGTGLGVSIGELVSQTEMHLKRKINVENDPNRVRPSKSEVWNLLADARLAAEKLDWNPTVNLDSGIQQTARWMRNRLHLWDCEQYVV